MTQVAERIKGEMLQLAEGERAELAQLLIASLDPTTDSDAAAAWDEELERRLRRMDDGQSTSRPAEDVLAEIRAKLQ